MKVDIFKWIFALLSVILIWQISLPNLFSGLALYFGAKENDSLFHVIIGFGIPAALTLLIGIISYLYNNLFWRLVSNSIYRGGWWIYSLTTTNNDTKLNVVGCFKINHKLDDITISNGRAYYADKDSLKYRGKWHSEFVINKENIINMVFKMETINPQREPIPSNYNGYIEIKKSLDSAILGKKTWVGYFQDLGDRKEFIGPIYAEKLKYWTFRKNNLLKIKTKLDNHYNELITRVNEYSE